MRFVIVLLVAGVGGTLLQIFLSKKESKWPGLVLPLLSLLIPLFALLAVAVFSSSYTEIGVVMENGVVTEQTAPMKQSLETGALFAVSAYVVLLHSIPTIVLFAIYAACRGKRGRLRALDKMNVQDLK
jgi:hypothetical protein